MMSSRAAGKAHASNSLHALESDASSSFEMQKGYTVTRQRMSSLHTLLSGGAASAGGGGGGTAAFMQEA